MMRYTITLGASTSAGGKVISASSPGSVDDANIALEDDKVTCPACRTIGRILCIGPRIPELWGSRQVALSDDLCLCGCSTPPKLIANQSVLYQVLENPNLTQKDSDEYEEPSESVMEALTGQEDEIVEQFFSLLDSEDRPVHGFHYDLFYADQIHCRSAHFQNGDTLLIQGGHAAKLVTWQNLDGASRYDPRI